MTFWESCEIRANFIECRLKSARARPNNLALFFMGNSSIANSHLLRFFICRISSCIKQLTKRKSRPKSSWPSRSIGAGYFQHNEKDIRTSGQGLKFQTNSRYSNSNNQLVMSDPIQRCSRIWRITWGSVMKLMIFTPLDSRYITWVYNKNSHAFKKSIYL